MRSVPPHRPLGLPRGLQRPQGDPGWGERELCPGVSPPHPPPRAPETPPTAGRGGASVPPWKGPRGGYVQWEGPPTLPVPPHSGMGPPHYVRGAPGHATLPISPRAHPGPPAGGDPADGKPTVGWERRARRPYPLPEGFEAASTPEGEAASGTLFERPSLPSGGEEIGRFFCADGGGSGGAWETSMSVPPGEGAGFEGASAPSRCSLLRCSVGAPGLHPTPIR